MKVKLHEIMAAKEDEISLSFSHNYEWLKDALGDDLFPNQAAHLQVETTAQMNGDEVLVRGQGEAKLSLCCSRCLEEAPQEISFSYDLLFAPRAKEPKPKNGAEILLQPEELDVDFFDGEEIDASDVAREQLVLALPLYPLCKEDCKGLCPTCGKNLNEGACACKPEQTIDPRLAKFAHIRLPDNKGGK